MLLLIALLILPVSASDYDDDFLEWNESYYFLDGYDNRNLENLFENLTEDNLLDEDDFYRLSYYYNGICFNGSSSQIKSMMADDFKSADLNKDGKLDYEEFKSVFGPVYKYSMEKREYEYFKDTDIDGDGLIDEDEFAELAYVFDEDKWFDEYSIEELIISEFMEDDEDGDGYLDFDEFKNFY